MNLIEHIDALLIEAKQLTASAIRALKPNDVVIVYHGTKKIYLPDFLNGIDTTRVKKRNWVPRHHKGLFVSPNIKTADYFERVSGQGVIIEFETKARNLHGTDGYGRLRDELSIVLTGRADKEFPDSFRPFLSYTLSQGEAQALHLGLIRPKDIRRVRVDGQWKDPSDLDIAGSLGGLDLSSPDLGLDDYLSIKGLPLSELPRILQSFKSVNDLADFLKGGTADDRSRPWGLPPLGPIAARSMAKKMWKLR